MQRELFHYQNSKKLEKNWQIDLKKLKMFLKKKNFLEWMKNYN